MPRAPRNVKRHKSIVKRKSVSPRGLAVGHARTSTSPRPSQALAPAGLEKTLLQAKPPDPADPVLAIQAAVAAAAVSPQDRPIARRIQAERSIVPREVDNSRVPMIKVCMSVVYLRVEILTVRDFTVAI